MNTLPHTHRKTRVSLSPRRSSVGDPSLFGESPAHGRRRGLAWSRPSRFVWSVTLNRRPGEQVIQSGPSSRTEATSQGIGPEMGACGHPR